MSILAGSEAFFKKIKDYVDKGYKALDTKKANKSDLSKVATSGKYGDLSGTPTLAAIATEPKSKNLEDRESFKEEAKGEAIETITMQYKTDIQELDRKIQVQIKDLQSKIDALSK